MSPSTYLRRGCLDRVEVVSLGYGFLIATRNQGAAIPAYRMALDRAVTARRVV
jgi:hypothetical protein